MTFFEFEGRWVLDRRITDHLAGHEGQLTGEAMFQRDGEALRYVERGQLHLPGQAPLESTQTYLWRPDGPGAAVFFSDGRPFHRVAFLPDWQTDHDCPPDQYKVRYDFAGWPGWTSQWTVTGPRKDYVMVSHYRRATA